MIAVDYFLFAILLVSALLGVFRGGIKEGLSLVGWLVAVWSAWRFGGAVADMIPSFADDSVVEIWVARVIVLIGMLIVVGLLARLIAYLAHQSGLSGIDRMIGMIFGLGRGVVLIALAVLFLDAVGFDADPWWQESKLIPYATPLAEWLAELAGDGIDLLQDQVDKVELPQIPVTDSEGS